MLAALVCVVLGSLLKIAKIGIELNSSLFIQAKSSTCEEVMRVYDSLSFQKLCKHFHSYITDFAKPWKNESLKTRLIMITACKEAMRALRRNNLSILQLSLTFRFLRKHRILKLYCLPVFACVKFLSFCLFFEVFPKFFFQVGS